LMDLDKVLAIVAENVKGSVSLTDYIDPEDSHPVVDLASARINKRFVELMDEHTRKSHLGVVARIKALYEANFTDAELEAMISWYETPVCKKCQALMPEFTGSMVEQITGYFNDRTEEIQAEIREIVESESVLLGASDHSGFDAETVH